MSSTENPTLHLRLAEFPGAREALEQVEPVGARPVRLAPFSVVGMLRQVVAGLAGAGLRLVLQLPRIAVPQLRPWLGRRLEELRARAG